jgi:methylthioribose-1-phosphate isomerase
VLDQTLLPGDERWLSLDSIDSVCDAIACLRVRGAPLLGIVGAATMAIAGESLGMADELLREAALRVSGTRPTAVELRTGADAALRVALSSPEDRRLDVLWRFAEDYLARRIREDRALGEHGADLLPAGSSVLTHCNTGALATGGIGTALGIVRVAWKRGNLGRCYATETRPLLQGARLTAWELKRSGIPATLLADTAAASLIASGKVQAVITGADRIALNGDAANKVGTYGLAAVAERHAIPFYVAAPRSTFDPQCATGASIPIEFRDGAEVGGFAGQRWSPEGLEAYNPAFDVTPGELITAFVTEAGVLLPPYATSLPALLQAP